MPRSDPVPRLVLEHPPPIQSVFFRLGQTVARRRWVVVAVWAALFAGSLALVPRFEAGLTGPPLGVGGSESMRAQAIIDQRFDHPIAEQDLVVFESERLTAADPAYREVVEESLQAVRHLSGVVEVVGPFDPLAEDQISLDGHVAVAIIGLSGSNETRLALAPRLTGAAASAATADVRVYVTGQSPLIAELVDQERQDLVRAELLGLPGAALVLLIASGTFVAAGLPPLLALTGGIVTFGVLGAATGFGNFNIFVPNLATMIGLGVGIDYSLFVVTRSREELTRGADPAAAVAAAVATAGKTVFVSGAAVLLSLAGLLLVDAEIFRELAFGAMTAVAVMMAGALTLLPAVLALLGHRVDRLRLPGRRPAAARVDSSGDLWARWARLIMRHPGRWAVAAVLVLAVLASPIRRLELALDTSTDALGQRPAGVGREILERDFNEGRISPVQVVLVSRDGPLDDRDLDAVARLSAALAQDGAVVDVVSVTTILDRVAGNHDVATLDFAASVPQAAGALGDLVNFGHGRDVAVINAVPRWSPDSPGPLRLVQRVRAEIVPRAIAGENVDVAVGGLSAQIVDITDETERKLPLVGGLIIALTYLLLALVFRSLVLPLKAIVMNVLSIAAAYGLLVVVFQEGAGERVFDFEATGSTQVYLPLLTFAVLFGLSMDYEVFLLGRIKEEWDRTGDNETAVARGLQRTAGIITAAAAIMVVVFAAFTFARLTEVKELGFSLATAVLIDATIVRIVLVPAAMRLLGRWNWWLPAWLDRLAPRIDLTEGEAGPPPTAATEELESSRRDVAV